MNATLLVAQGDASMTLNGLKVGDDGTYICTVSIGSFQAQQIVQLHVVRESQTIDLVQLAEDFMHLPGPYPCFALISRAARHFSLGGAADSQ